MSIIEHLTIGLDDKVANLGIGLGESGFHNNKILYATIKFLNTIRRNMFIKISLFGRNEFIDSILKNSSYEKYKEDILLVSSEEPEKELLNALEKYEINAAIRGSFHASKFLTLIKEKFKVSYLNRLALMETFNGFQYFYGPVGIDESNSYESKISYISESLNQFHSLRISPRVSILSGGRKDDSERDEKVKKTLQEAEDIVKYFKDIDSHIKITHDEICIEKSIEKGSNLIIAPDGISGNLAYRTLVHLGGGKAYGAIYLDLERTIIDTSRVGKLDEIYGALLLALALS
ncbi:MAG: methanogenesis marker protein Mmp4/MtxX [Candidatus Lokiarchaeota archaeon]|nr:methanogenesis marker protein Mmp4/MtxX [Candidatus Lokiarchaeota archaeon]